MLRLASRSKSGSSSADITLGPRGPSSHPVSSSNGPTSPRLSRYTPGRCCRPPAKASRQAPRAGMSRFARPTRERVFHTQETALRKASPLRNHRATKDLPPEAKGAEAQASEISVQPYIGSCVYYLAGTSGGPCSHRRQRLERRTNVPRADWPSCHGTGHVSTPRFSWLQRVSSRFLSTSRAIRGPPTCGV